MTEITTKESKESLFLELEILQHDLSKLLCRFNRLLQDEEITIACENGHEEDFCPGDFEIPRIKDNDLDNFLFYGEQIQGLWHDIKDRAAKTNRELMYEIECEVSNNAGND